MSRYAAPVIAPIVEGKGEQEAIGVLIRKIAAVQGTYVDVAPPFRVDSAKMRKPEELKRAILVQSARVPGNGGVLIVRDGDDKDVDCVVELAAELASTVTQVGAIAEVVIAAPEFEAWILASIDTVGSHRLISDTTPILDPESRRDAKGRLRAVMSESYRETIHQAAFAQLIDVGRASQRSRSFRRLVHAVESLATERR
ncbi:MAG: DUF4276 family protein [Gordonia sp. (in: high G+C Gram-positive bacteria)]|uniref:DUF4276 family protein n=1 Tax=Gordonia sp. (in: high G+C Gram-positive bacteria) TaxID=84139 RepID=UPI0039E2E548